MRLASKIFLTSALVIVVLAGVAALSLRAIDRLVSANRDIVTRTVPALRLTATAREAIEPLMRLDQLLVERALLRGLPVGDHRPQSIATPSEVEAARRQGCRRPPR